MASPRFLVGIDLGTTNTVVAYCEITDNLEQSEVSLFDIDQLIGPGEVVRKPLLPSFRYHPAQGQISPSDLTLPWENQPVSGDIKNVIVGEWARELGAKVEGRQVSSAKSWLSHQAVDRSSDILPWAGAQDVDKVSPVIASASYLNHIRQAWNYRHPSNKLEDQDVVVTVPASFDETARKLTLEAAELAGLKKIVLLEEPQAVCYDWYARHQQTAADELKDLPLILVCDVGGGTTDLSLIEAKFKQSNDSESELALDRIGVGEHLMLGGDNLDLALAHLAESRFNQNKKLTAASLTKLIQQTRKAKENLLSSNAPEEVKITMLGSGSKLLGGTKSIALSKQEVHQIALDGFFPLSEFNEVPDKRRSAVVEFGLPYVADPAVSKHVAEFLTQHQQVSRSALGIEDEKQNAIPVGLLLNGGVFNSDLVTERVTTLLSDWRGAPVTVLDNPHPDWSVALGAVAFGKARRGAQLKIGGGAARSYFLHLQEKNKMGKALCLLAKGTEEGHEIRLSGRRFSLTLGEPVRFNLLTSTHDTLTNNTAIQNGVMVDVDPDLFVPLPPYITTLEGEGAELHANQKERVEVQLACQLTEVGTLKMECVSAEDDTKRWALEFEVRNKQADDNEDVQLHPKLNECKELVARLYSGNKKSADSKEIKTLAKDLEKKLGKRDEWDFTTLRQLFDAFAQGRKRRRRSEQHEKNWLRLAGFALRPGFGDPTDSWRIEQIWGLYQQNIQFKNHQGWTDWWVFWRRIAGGLNQEQQETILADIAKYLHPGAMKNPQSAKAAQDMGYESMVRLSASLENLEVEDKVLLATWFLSKAINQNQFQQAHWWAMGRLASRTPLYGSQHNVIPREQAEQWLPKLLDQNWQKEPMIAFAAVMICRKTGDRLFDISDDYREQVLAKLKQSKVPESWVSLVEEVKELSDSESKRVFGDALPSGLTLVHH
ncbi:Hsp70 family protein [Vibrio natriegens]|uniref:Molecular chaperone DnaK n=1 Tax=Vibrio natriegens NBRC 15636 = ATCC 14048 = DSM 759 TaxID=1219067 RepID=A0AAN1CVJ0_VIBNA|nr:Hsp70 family protein [Vibrio natriegens]ALR15569.1 molecular chaperone DnaK [Vibrio natriegens NBRC 15636 = ATCC 14048 = DSM 759]ANQ12574.1 molecular chaperone DnaK [Vibrio natriegens NBRC 15636 = ATCC 14048 = DSM 759]EPM42398.1 molecular chaperone DnaK [Vibrio natriegens NBRC 15636 = ATCC 14048 = DSM 759]MDX6026961.1 Hsp70 family protein [Vibrio natriegens NBRC 15636 = ATCC 14048 = DSM 759]UUI13044.1 hsp70 family protein [Vibrio natriegens]